ncbi:MAG: hypothetical protein C4278_02190 [Patescibacteria group bacterium]
MILNSLVLVFILVFFFSFLFVIINQPLLIAYILSGVFVSHLLPLNEIGYRTLESFSEIGLALLLFLVGIELNLRLLKEISKKAVLIGVLQEVLTIILGFFFLILLGFQIKESIILAAALSFSSTAIVLKIFSDKKELETYHGRLIIGFMIVQDLIALISFIFFPLIFKESLNLNELRSLLVSVLILLPILYLIHQFIKKLEKLISSSLEFLFIFALFYFFSFLYLTKLLNFSLETGALISGLLLANYSFSKEIISRLKPLRDFFLIIFFVFLGSKFSFQFLDADFILKSILISIFVIVFNPLIVMFIMRLFNFPKRINFIVSLSSGQASEFSFVLFNLSEKINIFNRELVSMGSFVGFITIFVSTYLLYYYEKIYNLVKNYLRFLDVNVEEKKLSKEKIEIVLFGCDRVGGIIKNFLKEKNKNFVVVDYNYEIVKNLEKENLNVIYGDAEEIDVLENINFQEAKIVISTIPNKNLNIFLLDYIKKIKKEIIFICVASREEEKKELEKLGADLVVIPYTLGGEYLAKKIENIINF